MLVVDDPLEPGGHRICAVASALAWQLRSAAAAVFVLLFFLLYFLFIGPMCSLKYLLAAMLYCLWRASVTHTFLALLFLVVFASSKPAVVSACMRADQSLSL